MVFRTIEIFKPPCDYSCSCNNETFAPICGSDGKTYFSSCHAGCNSSHTVNGKIVFDNCLCIPGIESQLGGSANNGYCETDCGNVNVFVAIFVVIMFVHSSSEVGRMLLTMRCTHPKDKAMAMGIIQFAIGLFGQIPCPIIYGSVVDAACRVWGKICGTTGHCTFYDNDHFRKYFLGEFMVLSVKIRQIIVSTIFF